MKYLPLYIPVFGLIIVYIEDRTDLFNLKNPHLYGTGLFHGIFWGQILIG